MDPALYSRFAQKALGEAIGLAAVVLLQRPPEQRFVRCDGGEQSHRGMEFQVVGRTEDPVCRASLDGEHEFNAFAQARAEDGIPESLRTIRAWVCATPHCRYRETAF